MSDIAGGRRPTVTIRYWTLIRYLLTALAALRSSRVPKKNLDTYPILARSPEPFFKVNGETLERNYKEVLSGFDTPGGS